MMTKLNNRSQNVHWLPYAVGCLIAYAKQFKEINDAYSFMEPLYLPHPYVDYNDQLEQADILCLTTYVWNQKYNDGLARHYKTIRPDGLVIYGGANVPEDKELAQTYADIRPQVDLFLVGPGEANFKTFLLNRDKPLYSHVGTFSRSHNNVNVNKDLYALPAEDIPNPYLAGVFDSIVERIDEKIIGITFESTRGCPFRCSFCDWGGLSRSIVHRIENKLLWETIDWIYAHGNKIQIVDIIDANLGMVERDLHMIKYFAECQERTGHRIKVTTNGFVKNGSKWLHELILTLHGIFGYSKNVMLSFQTHSQAALDVIDRSNIRNERLYPLIEQLKAGGVQIQSEMILGLPGETVESWTATLEKDVQLGISRMRGYPLIVIPNTPIYSKEFREKYQVKTKRIWLPHDMFLTKDQYLGDPHAQTQCQFDDDQHYEEIEILYECFSFNNDQLVEILKRWWWYHNLSNLNLIQTEIQEAHAKGFTVSEQIAMFFKYLDEGKMPTLQWIVNLFEETIRELYAPEPLTKVKSAHAIQYFQKGMRTFEPAYFVDNKQKIAEELSLIYGNVESSHWVHRKGLYIDDTISK